MHATALRAGLAALAESQSATSTDATERQQRYAQEQLAAAAAREVSGSMALFGMAKLATVQAADEHAKAAAHLAQARTLYQAALLAEPNNFCAASELGVLLVESGKYPAARELLIRSVSLAPHAVTWHNLAVVHARLGETQLAEQATERAKAMEASAAKVAVPSVEWVDAQTFARTSSATENTLPAKPPAPRVPVDVAKKGFGDWLPWTGSR
jgi:tetratricopeptide (TPR) repeat protein